MPGFKLQCPCEAAALYLSAKWPHCTYKRGTAVLVYQVTPDQLAVIQSKAQAHTIELTDDDKRVLQERLTESCSQQL